MSGGSGVGLYTQLPPNDAAEASLRRMAPEAMVLVDEALAWARRLADTGIYFIFRPYGLLPDSYWLPESPDHCYREGRDKAEAALRLLGGVHVHGLISLNERQPQNEADAKRVGAFEGGFASVVCPAGYDHHAFNWSVGYDHSDLVVAAWAEMKRRYDSSRQILAYHAYTATTNQVDAPYYELRPWAYWQRLFSFAGLVWPRVSLTECGHDDGENGRNGWRHKLTEVKYAAYLRRLLYLTPDAFCRVVFGWRLHNTELHPWVDLGFDIEGAELIEQTIAEINGTATPIPNGGDTMPSDLAHEIWDAAWRWEKQPRPAGYNPNTAIGAYREGHPLLGMPLTGEFDHDQSIAISVGTWPVVVQVFAGGEVLARKTDWKPAGAMTEGDVRTLLAGPLA